MNADRVDLLRGLDHLGDDARHCLQPCLASWKSMICGDSAFSAAISAICPTVVPSLQGGALRAQEVWAIRFELQHRGALRDKCLFDMAIDSKLRGCDLVKLRIDDIASGGVVRHRAMVVQQKTGRPVQFELTETTRESTAAWLVRRRAAAGDFLFPSRIGQCDHLGTRQ